MAVYLIHLEQPLAHARHYVGFAKEKDCKRRIARHRSGNGARMLAVANQRGIAWEVARIWEEGDRKFERQLKRRGDKPALCPLCREEYLARRRTAATHVQTSNQDAAEE